MRKGLSVFNVAEWAVVLASIVLICIATQNLKSPYGEISRALVGGFWTAIAISRSEKSRQQNTDKPKQRDGSREYKTKYKRLLNMLGGNKETCDSLIQAYGIDRAIDDLIRDRR